MAKRPCVGAVLGAQQHSLLWSPECCALGVPPRGASGRVDCWGGAGGQGWTLAHWAARLRLVQWLWVCCRAGPSSRGAASTPGVRVGGCGTSASRWCTGPCFWSWEARQRVPEGHPPALVLPRQTQPPATAAASVSMPGASCCLLLPRGSPQPAACLPQAPCKPLSQVSCQTVCRMEPLSPAALGSRARPPCWSSLSGANCGVSAGAGRLAVFPLWALGALGESRARLLPGFLAALRPWFAGEGCLPGHGLSCSMFVCICFAVPRGSWNLSSPARD